MLFAFLYVLFFGLDIFISSKFLTIGMIPMNFLVSGVALFFILFIRKRSISFPKDDNRKGIHTYFMVYISSIFFLRILLSMDVFSFIFPEISISFIRYLTDFFLIFYSACFMFLFRNGLWKDDHLSKWLRWSMIFSFLKCTPHVVFFYIPVLIHRYDGIVDLAMIFCWLMIIRILMQKEFSHRIEDYANTYVH